MEDIAKQVWRVNFQQAEVQLELHYKNEIVEMELPPFFFFLATDIYIYLFCVFVASW